MFEINSKDYWNSRFNTNWVEMLGRQQSAFFASKGLTGFPAWLTSQIKNNNWTICDWGCALGDGTNELSHFFPENNITGIDFSEVAIANAKEQYPGINFECKNLLEGDILEEYDVIFTSNVLEHFSNPWEILALLRTFAKKNLVVLIPYKEFERHAEHEYTFDESNIPVNINEDFYLTDFKLMDTGKCTPSYWGGLQVLLVYSEKENITLNNLSVLKKENILEIDQAFFAKDLN